MIELSLDVLEKLHDDGEFVLSRGWREDRRSSLLVVAPASEHPSPTSLRRLEHAYELRDALDPTWAARPLALSNHRGQLTLMLEDPGGETLDRFLPGPMEMTQFLRFAAGFATALSGLHKSELIHKDLKPANVLVNSVTGEVRLMGFGIARDFRASARHPNLPSSSPEHSPTWRPNKPDE